MIKYNDIYEAEIRDIVENNPKNYIKILKSRGFKGRYPDRQYLIDYIYSCTPLLKDGVHTLKTRIYWTLNRLVDFPVCMNSLHGEHKMFTVNVKKLKDGYPKYCDTICQHEAPSYHEAVKNAIREKYGVDNAFQIDSVKHDLDARKDVIQSKRDMTRKAHFGDLPGWNLEKSLNTRRAKYGSAWNKVAVAHTKFMKHGNPSWNNPEKNFETKRKRGTLNESYQEKIVAEVVRSVRPNIMLQYKSVEYPFACDMYDPDTNTYFEYNGSWTHGGHPYNPNSPEDTVRVTEWKSKMSKYYDNAVETWTVRDPRKRKTAEENGIDLVELWNYEDVERYFCLGFSLKDWLYFRCDNGVLLDEYNRFVKLCGSSKWEKFIESRNASNLIVKYFQQDVFYAAEKIAWTDPSVQGKLLENRMHYLGKKKKDITDLDLLDGFKRSGMIYGYSHFNPKLFIWFIRKYGARQCYDPFGGWGHRLLGAAGLDLYIYNDKSKHVKYNVDRIISRFGIKNVVTYCEDAALLDPAEDFDSMFTCPPYFNVEEYECGKFRDFDEYRHVIDSTFDLFHRRKSCRVFGLVTREDMLCGHADYVAAFDINAGRSYHLGEKTVKPKERRYRCIKRFN